MHASHHAGTAFIVPQKDQSPDVGYWPTPYQDSIQDEVAELAAQHCRTFPLEREKLFKALVAFGLAIIVLLKERAVNDVEDGVLLSGRPTAVSDAEIHRRILSAGLGRLLDWVCKGRATIDMGPRIFAVASHVRAAAVDHRTDQQAASEMGNGARWSIGKLRSEFRAKLGAEYPGENGRGEDTKSKCKKSRIKQLKN